MLLSSMETAQCLRDDNNNKGIQLTTQVYKACSFLYLLIHLYITIFSNRSSVSVNQSIL